MNKHKDDIISEAVDACLEDLYKYSVPSMSFNDIKQACKNNQPYDKKYWQHHYIPQDLMNEIMEGYRYAYRLEPYFQIYTDVLKEYLLDGGTTEVYKKDDSLVGGHRDFEKTPNLETVIGKEAAEKVKDLIEKCQRFYRFDSTTYGCFEGSVNNYAPISCRPEEVIEYWKSQGIDIEIDDEKIRKNYYREEWGEEDDEETT